MKKLQKQIKLAKELLKDIEDGYGKDKCKGYAPGCPNCQGQLLVGYLVDYLELLEWERDQK